MNDGETSKLKTAVHRVVELLVAKRYSDVESIPNGIRLTGQQIETAIVDYGRTLVAPPAIAYDEIDIVPIVGTSPSEYSVRFRLYTKEEGRSDLELQATAIDDPSGSMRVEIDNILVA